MNLADKFEKLIPIYFDMQRFDKPMQALKSKVVITSIRFLTSDGHEFELAQHYSMNDYKSNEKHFFETVQGFLAGSLEVRRNNLKRQIDEEVKA